MAYLSQLELAKENMNFSAGHFTIFSATQREPLHGHNYRIAVTFDMEVGEDGLTVDYRYYKHALRELCQEVDQTFLLPSQSKYLRLEEVGDLLFAYFNDEKIPFLQKDVTILPITNVTVEELARWFIGRLTESEAQLIEHKISAIEVKVYSGPGQSGACCWEVSHD